MTLKVTVTEDVSTVSVSGDTTSINLTGEQTEISVVNPATSVTFTPSQSFSSTNVQDALFEAHEMIGQQSNDYSIQLSNANKFEISSGSAFLRMYATGSQFGWDASLISSDDLKLVSHGTNTIATFKDTSIEFHDSIYMTGNVPGGEDYRYGYINTNNPNTSARHHYVLQSNDQKVGYIGAVGSGTTAKVFIGEGNNGVAVRSIPFVGAEFTPVDLQGNDEDAFTDLGTSTARFKDLYLSGGVHLGGTGSANKLDDYEEGTFTPTFYFGTSNHNMETTRDEGAYTKIGRFVVCTIVGKIATLGYSTGNISVRNLPFTVGSTVANTTRESVGFVSSVANTAIATNHLGLVALQNTTEAIFNYTDSSYANKTLNKDDISAGFEFKATLTYFVD